jgi:hydrogenase expression/formation protein HypC
MCLAIPGKVVELTTASPHLALVEVAGVRRQINVDLVREDALAEGDWVLIHVGFAMSKISAAAADEQMRLLAMLGEDLEAMREIEGYDLAVADGGGPGGGCRGEPS